jgi:hypothetical protein
MEGKMRELTQAEKEIVKDFQRTMQEEVIPRILLTLEAREVAWRKLVNGNTL